MRTFKGAVALLLGALAFSLQAAGLGDLEVQSNLNRPLLAVLPDAASDIETEGLDVRIVDPGWAEDPGLRARVREHEGSRDIVITSARPVREPVFVLRLKVRADNAVLTREYPVILDPPHDLVATAPATVPSAIRKEAPAPLPAAPASPSVAPGPAAPLPAGRTVDLAAFDARCSSTTPGETAGFDSARDVYGPVTDGESLRLVALRVRPWRNCAPLQVLMSSIYRQNAEAFYGTPDRLRAGRVLEVPATESLRAFAADLRSRLIPSPAGRPVRPDDEAGPALPGALLLTGLVSAAHAGAPEANFAALEMTVPARQPPPAQGAAIVAPRAAPDRSTGGRVPMWALALVLATSGIMLFTRLGPARRPAVIRRPLRDAPARSMSFAPSPASGQAPPAFAGRPPAIQPDVPAPESVPLLDQAPGEAIVQAPAPLTAMPAETAAPVSVADTPAALPAAAALAVADDPWESLLLANRRLTGQRIDDGIQDTACLVHARSGAAAVEEAAPQMTEIVDLLKATLGRQPSRLDLQMKLFEVYHDLRLCDAFQAEARRVAGDRWVTTRIDWSSINTLWQDLSPGTPLLERPAAAVPVPEATPVPAATQAPAATAASPRRDARTHRRFADVAAELAAGPLAQLAAEYEALRADPEFFDEVGHFAARLLSRPTPLTAKLSSLLGGTLFLKREDQRAIAPEVDNALVQAIVAQIMGRKRLVTGNDVEGHSLALAMAAARLQIECLVYLRPSDFHDNVALVSQLRLLGARIEMTDPSSQVTEDPREGALREWMKDPDASFLALSLGTGPHPYPLLVSDARTLLGRETLGQFRAQTGTEWPAAVVASTSSRADSLGFMLPFLQRDDVQLAFAETPCGDAAGESAPYRGLRREHAWLRSTGRVEYVNVASADADKARQELASFEGICISPADAAAVALAQSLVGTCGAGKAVLVLVA